MTDSSQIIEAEESDTEVVALKQPIISYGADYTLDTVRQYVNDNQIIVTPSFQRNYVWDIKRASKLIESFLLGYPVPNILLGRPQNDEKMEVIDGQQRILTIAYFFSGKFKNEVVFKLTGDDKDDLDERFRNKTFEQLDDVTQRKLRSSILKAVIVVYPPQEPNIKFSVFQRINSGSVVLNQQEIRNSIFGGNFNDMLIDINKNNLNWRKFFSKKPDKRMRDIEAILRFFAAYFYSKNYETPQALFLNNFMDKNQNKDEPDLKKWRLLFEETLEIVIKNIGNNAFSSIKKGRSINRAIFESVMYAVAKLKNESRLNVSTLKKKHVKLLENVQYIESITSGTADKKSYNQRLHIALETLA
jgi:hypothetical protein